MNGIYEEVRIVLYSVWQRRWLALAVAWGVSLLGWLLIAMVPNQYESRARMLVDVNEVLPGSQNMGDQVRQIAEIRQTLTSARNLEKVAITTGLVQAGAGDREKADKVAMLQKNIEVSAQQDNIFQIRAIMSVGSMSDAENARLATAVVDSLISIFRDEQVRGGRSNTRDSLKFLDDQLAQREKELREAEAARVKFEGENFGVLPGSGGSASSRMAMARSELSQIDSQLVSAQAAVAAINGQLASTPASIQTPGISSTGAGVARQQLSQAQIELSGMRARGLTDEHPDVVAILNQIASLQAQAQREGGGGGGGMISMPNPAYASLRSMQAERSATLTSLQARKAQLQAEMNGLISKQGLEPQAQAELERLNRDYDVLKAKFDELRTKREQVRLTQDIETETDPIRVEVLDPPTKPRVPIAPNRPLLLAMALIVGIGAGGAAAFAVTHLQTTYPTASKLEKASGLPVIGSVAEVVYPQQREDEKKRLVWLAGGFAGLLGMFLLLLVVEFVQRGLVA